MEWKIPLFDVDIESEEIEGAIEILKSGWLTAGPCVQKFEKAFIEYLDVKHAFAVSSCTAALHIANLVLDIKESDEVICPSLTFVATVNAIRYVGAKPVFADITSAEDWNISPNDIENKITDKTKSINLVHYGGYPCDMDAIMDIAQRHNLSVVEDCAHAPGAICYSKVAKVKDKMSYKEIKQNQIINHKSKQIPYKVGTIGDVGCFSFFSNKNLTTGEGGMITTNRDDLAEKIKLARSHGTTVATIDRHKGHSFDYDVISLGYNYRFDELRAAIGLVQLKKLDEKNNRRKKIAKLYYRLLGDIKGLEIPFIQFKHHSVYHIFPVLIPRDCNRFGFMSMMKEAGVQTSIHYRPVHSLSFYKNDDQKDNSLPIVDSIAERIVTLPLYPGLTPEQVKYVAGTVEKVIKSMLK